MATPSTVATPAPRTCTGCGNEQPLDAFPFKNKATGRRQSRCKTCQSAYNRDHHAANKDTINPRIHARNARVEAELHTLLAATRSTLRCGACGTDGQSAVLSLRQPDGGRRTLAELAKNAPSEATFRAAIDRAVERPDDVLCASCLGRATGGARRSQL